MELAPDDVSSLNALGAAYHNSGQWDEARRNWERAFAISPNCDNCNNVGLMYYYETRYWDAAKYYETAMSYCDSTDHGPWGNWAAAMYWVDGQRKRAIALYEKAADLAALDLANGPEEAELISSLIDYLAMSGRREETLAMIDRGLPYVQNDPEMAFCIGTAYAVLDDRNAALNYIGEAIRHGYSLERIERSPELRDLRLDARYQQMVAEKKRAEP